MRILRFLLFPVVPIYWLVTWFRNQFYDNGIFSSKSYALPVICVGNLSTGGTGKTPMVEYLIRLLKPHLKVATLSRGYKRKSQDFVLAATNSTSGDIGDEPLQFYKNNPEIYVAVDKDRQNGIERLLNLNSKPEVILLDDAFQHRKVKAGFNILLTSYGKLYSSDIVLPTGNLREPHSGAKRADVVVVTKCPKDLNKVDKAQIALRLSLKSHQKLFFSYIDYSEHIFNGVNSIPLEELQTKNFTLVTGIANSNSLVAFLKSKGFQFEHLDYPDHHNFTTHQINELKTKEFILTTEKDYIRLSEKINEDKLYYLPIKTSLDRETEFNNLIFNFCKL